jgi:3-hydroxyacyl-CoA dehydrogenase/enoyl-CoA hydratase/3-hydroxybutyryl-CoA epimerase
MQNEAKSDTSGATSGASRLEFHESGLAILYLGHSTEKVISLTVERINSIKESIQRLKQQKPPGLIIASHIKEMFTVGADINLIKGVTVAEEGERLAREGQLLFDEIESLPFPTIAAISGPCVGGGCELALSCKFRIISDDKSSSIGLPEIKLGILPGFGGTQRLPRLIGLPKALDIILAGKVLKPKQALACGLVDEITSFDNLFDRAVHIALDTTKVTKKKLKFLDKILTYNSWARNFLRGKVLKAVKKQTKGFYPAPPAALDCAVYGLQHGMAEGIKNEAKALGKLIITPESKSLVNVFFLSEASKALGKAGKKAIENLYAQVIGAGVMGAGIAVSIAKNEAPVILKDNSDEALKRGLSHIKNHLSGLKYLSPSDQSFINNRIEATTKDSPNAGNVNFLIEAVFEDLKLKTKLLSEASKVVSNECIIATNTSSLSVNEIAAGIDHPERVIGMHFFNPVEKMPLVEIIRCKSTADKTVALVAALTVKLGKFPIVVDDVPGFLVNRILTPYLNEAAFLISEGYHVSDIDKAAVEFGMPMGPIRLLDEVGLDVASHVSEIMSKAYGARMQAPTYSRMLLNMGRKGKKSGGGFYDFTEKSSVPNPTLREKLNLAAAPKTDADLNYLRERLVLALINEAVRCLDEGVAGIPSKEAANQIDLGTVMGMGFPPFRGGLLHYANSLGTKKVYSSLLEFHKQYGERYKPSDGIKARAENGLNFY